MRNSAFHYLAWIGRIILGIAIGYVFLQSKTSLQSLVSLIVFFLASLIPLFFGRKLPSLIDFLLILAALVNAGAWIWKAYTTVPFYDEVTHTYTTFALTFAIGYLLLERKFRLFEKEKLLVFILILSIGISLGTLWEIYEWIIDFFVPGQIIRTLFDTITDLILDSIGALAAAGLIYYLLKKKEHIQTK